MYRTDPEPEPEIKRLCFTLYKRGLKKFLLTESFEGILLDYDRFDVMWGNIRQRVIEESRVNILVPGYTGYDEETMERFLNTIYLSKDRRLLPFLDQLLLELSNENDLRPIVGEIQTRLKQMKFNDSKIKGMKAFKQIMSREYFQAPKTRGSLANQQLTETELFPKKQFKVDDRLCFILMPFDEKYSSVYDNIRHATEEMGLKAKRADNIFNVKPIIHDVWEHINKAKFLIANLSGKNPNVFYEVGLSHALNKKVILITYSMKDVPFDLRHLRCIVYKDMMDGAGEFKDSLIQTIKELMNE
jgi:hypothetical protein